MNSNVLPENQRHILMQEFYYASFTSFYDTVSNRDELNAFVEGFKQLFDDSLQTDPMKTIEIINASLMNDGDKTHPSLLGTYVECTEVYETKSDTSLLSSPIKQTQVPLFDYSSGYECALKISTFVLGLLHTINDEDVDLLAGDELSFSTKLEQIIKFDQVQKYDLITNFMKTVNLELVTTKTVEKTIEHLMNYVKGYLAASFLLLLECGDQKIYARAINYMHVLRTNQNI